MGPIAPEYMQKIDHTDEGIAFCIEDAQNIVYRLENKSVPGAKTLVGRLNGELISIVGKTLIVEIQAIKRGLNCIVIFPSAIIVRAIAMTVPSLFHSTINGGETNCIVAGVSVTRRCTVNFELTVCGYSQWRRLWGGCAAT